MSGDVTAAIERMEARRRRGGIDGGPAMLFADSMTLLAEVEGLRSSVPQRTIDYLQAELVKQSNEVERLRNDLTGALVIKSMQAEEIERLRAEREALHSDEAEARFVEEATGATVGPLYNLSELTAGDAGNIWTAVLSVLTADPEADQ